MAMNTSCPVLSEKKSTGPSLQNISPDQVCLRGHGELQDPDGFHDDLPRRVNAHVDPDGHALASSSRLLDRGSLGHHEVGGGRSVWSGERKKSCLAFVSGFVFLGKGIALEGKLEGK